uniref:Heat shock protein 70 n=1 Tax=Panagrolaimus davidi TaxID=227884 RepID=A0A914PDZ1_9BILA
MGKRYSEIAVDPMWSFKLKNSFNSTEVVVETCEGIKFFSPEEIAAVFLKDIKNKVEVFQNTHLSEVVITFPALYDETQKQALLKAAKFAGWKIIYLIPEPIAAAFAYCDEVVLELDLNILIFDLGGGTLDISVVRTPQFFLHVLSFNGTEHCCNANPDEMVAKGAALYGCLLKCQYP